MPRPSKPRKVKALPKNAGFCPKGQPECSHPIILNVEEYETIRLIDYVGLTQEECALSMGVGRATVQSLYVEARKKLARFVVEASGLLIEGGNYEICSEKITGTKIKKEKGDLKCRYFDLRRNRRRCKKCTCRSRNPSFSGSSRRCRCTGSFFPFWKLKL